MPPYLFTNFKIKNYYQYQPRFNGVYSRNDLHKIKDGAYPSWWVQINRNLLNSIRMYQNNV